MIRLSNDNILSRKKNLNMKKSWLKSRSEFGFSFAIRSMVVLFVQFSSIPSIKRNFSSNNLDGIKPVAVYFNPMGQKLKIFKENKGKSGVYL